MKKCSHKLATKPELLVTKDEMLVATVTVSVAISSPEVLHKILKKEKKARPATYFASRLISKLFLWNALEK